VTDWLLRKLADLMGVAAAEPGEATTPRLRFEQPLVPQWFFVFILLGSAALIVWLYWHEGKASRGSKLLLAGLRMSLVLLAMFMLSEAVLSVERKGLPYLTILVDDSASQRIPDQYEDPEIKTRLDALAAPAKSDQTTRLAIAKGLILKDHSKLLRELEKKHKVRLYAVSNSTRRLSEIDLPNDIPGAETMLLGLEAAGSQSRLGDGVRFVLTELRGAPPTAIILLSDGQTTEGEPLSKAAALAEKKGVPLFTIGLGSPEKARDIELTELLVDDVVFVDDAVRFQAKLSARGFAGEKAVVRLKELEPGSKDPASAREIDSKEVELPSDTEPKRVELVHHPKTTGERIFIIEVDRLPRELQTDNNRIERVVNVRKEKLRVLVVDSEPRYEYRYLKNYLERDETIDLNVVLLSSDPNYSDQDRSAIPTFPASKDDLFTYDVVLFGDADVSYLSVSQLQNLVEFVTEKGGGILFVAGDLFNPLAYQGTPLELLLPIELSSDARNPTAAGTSLKSFRPELTVEGRGSPIFRFGDDDASSMKIWDGLPELFWYFEAPRRKPAALVLAEHPVAMGSDGKLPLVLYQFMGAGKSMFHAFDDTWRWRYRAGDRYFGRFWVQTIRFLARSRLVGQRQAEVQTDRRRYQRGQPIQFRVRFPNAGLAPKSGDLTIQVGRAGQGSRKLSLKLVPGTRNVFEAALPQAAEGDYEVRLLPPPVLEGPIPTTTFRVDAPVNEFERIEMNSSELLRAAELTKGKFYTPLVADALVGDLPKPSPILLDTDPPIPLWNTWPVLALFLALLTLEWVFRKRNQMV
jgi:von Willebrand factor type A domain